MQNNLRATEAIGHEDRRLRLSLISKTLWKHQRQNEDQVFGGGERWAQKEKRKSSAVYRQNDWLQ